MDTTLVNIAFDLNAAVDSFSHQCHYYLSPEDECGAFLQRLNRSQQKELLLAHARQIAEQQLSPIVRPEDALSILEDHLVQAYSNIRYPEHKSFIEGIIHDYYQLFGDEWEYQINQYFGSDQFIVWEVEVNPLDELLFIYVGDYRILEWEREHVNKGHYVKNAMRY